MKKGFFISLEGIEGAGKSTLLRMLKEALDSEGYEVLTTFEPGDTKAGARIREILLDPALKGLSPFAELLLYFSDRAEHVEKLLKPALNSGKVVLCDRFMDSTFAYQGYGRGLELETLFSLNRLATGGLKPDLTLLFDLDVRTGLRRNRNASKNDRFEQESLQFHERVRKGFLELASKEPDRFVVIDASLPIDKVFDRAKKEVLKRLQSLG
ncbi:MAG: dTMP kinase [Nitrospirae bacterium]|nr:MAG: dTMP kinase [Nitrospirota bacterium]